MMSKSQEYCIYSVLSFIALYVVEIQRPEFLKGLMMLCVSGTPPQMESVTAVWHIYG